MSHTIYDANILANGECENRWKDFRDSCYLLVRDLLESMQVSKKLKLKFPTKNKIYKSNRSGNPDIVKVCI
jgi:hypothetical protein